MKRISGLFIIGMLCFSICIGSVMNSSLHLEKTIWQNENLNTSIITEMGELFDNIEVDFGVSGSDDQRGFNCTPEGGKYSVFWVCATTEYGCAELYSVSGYSNRIGRDSASETSESIWILWKPTQTEAYYPIGFSSGGDIIYLEWQQENATLLQLGSQDITPAIALDLIEIYSISLSNSKSYDFNLTISSDQDNYDLYLYYLEGDQVANSTEGHIAASNSGGWGESESILNFIPPKSGKYCLLTNSSAYGNFTASIQVTVTATSISQNGDGKLRIIFLIVVFPIIGIIVAVVILKRKRRILS